MNGAAGRERIAVVGSGIAGLTCAHVLGPHHDVVLFEASTRLGGHANTVEVSDPGAGRLAIDTGFIVHNDRNYPNLVALFDELGVATVDTSMSFGVTDRDPGSPTRGFTYRATNPNTIFADRSNLVRPAMWRMLRDILRFHRTAREFLESGDDESSLQDFLDRQKFSRELVELHLIPMGAAVWSSRPDDFAHYPARHLFGFLDNHGLLTIGDRPQWRTIPGGSRTYVDAIAARFDGDIRTGSPVASVERVADGVEVVSPAGAELFDRVVLATHSNQSLAMLTDASPVEEKVLGAVRYQPNRATLHTDTSLLSPERRAWSAWNYDRLGPGSEAATVTYDMTALQHLPGGADGRRYLVSLNSDDRIDPGQVLASFDYSHPVLDGDAFEAQARFDEIDGVDRVHYCGAWWGHGFHEDGMVSALRVCHRIGVDWPSSTLGPTSRSDDARRSHQARTAGPALLEPGPAAIAEGHVSHRRSGPTPHSFRYPVSYVWLDPDDPDEFCDRHPLWSARRPAPARFRRSDYGLEPEGSLAVAARDDVTEVVGARPRGAVRMLAQVRRWGWLFNPITVYVVWDDDESDPVGAVLEVTNTPWRERTRYPIAWHRDGTKLVARTDKAMHVSPFLDEDHHYEVSLSGNDRLVLGIDVVPRGEVEPVLETVLAVKRSTASRTALARSLWTRIGSTHRVSLGIHREALRLWRAKVPFVAHPRRR